MIVATAAYRLGLTGGIGSGKTTIAGMLAQVGATVVDADAISRATTSPGGSAIAMLKSTFGASMLAADGSLDREQMRNLIYSDPTAKARLEYIVHPLVGQEIARQAQLAEARGATCIVFDIPLLVESKNWRATLQRILVIDCSEHTQIERVTARNGLDTASVMKILAAQASRTQRLDAADMVIFNDGIDMNALALQVHEIGTQFGL